MDDSSEVPPTLAIDTIRALDRKALVGTGLTVATAIPALLILVLMISAFMGGVAYAGLSAIGAFIASTALVVIGVRNLRRSATRRAAMLALLSTEATASLADDTLEIHMKDGSKSWRFALGGRAKTLRALPAARLLGKET